MARPKAKQVAARPIDRASVIAKGSAPATKAAARPPEASSRERTQASPEKAANHRPKGPSNISVLSCGIAKPESLLGKNLVAGPQVDSAG